MVLLEFEEFDLFSTLVFVNDTLLLMSSLQCLNALFDRPYFVLVALLFVLELLDLVFQFFLTMLGLELLSHGECDS